MSELQLQKEADTELIAAVMKWGISPSRQTCDVGKPASPLPDRQHPALAVLRRWP
jgi:hypothetical protein